MDKITFKVYAKNNLGAPMNPIPYKRTTQRGARFDVGYAKYLKWKEMVQRAYVNAIQGKWEPLRPILVKGKERLKRINPIDDPGPWFVEVFAFYKDRTHGDNDNIGKGILDALFQNDKDCISITWPHYCVGPPRVEITLQKLPWFANGNINLGAIQIMGPPDLSQAKKRQTKRSRSEPRRPF